MEIKKTAFEFHNCEDLTYLQQAIQSFYFLHKEAWKGQYIVS